jgi:hypothetical protein
MDTQTEAVAYALDHELDYTKLLLRLLQVEPGFVLDILKPDMDRFAAEFLSRRPELFLTYAKQQVSGIEKMQKIVDHLIANSVIDAIKVLREDTGLGLKEAKDVIVFARDQLVTRGKLASTTSRPGTSVNTVIKLEPLLMSMAVAIIAEFP